MGVTAEKEDNHNVIYRPWIRTRNGRKIYARHYGLKAFRIKVKKKKDNAE